MRGNFGGSHQKNSLMGWDGMGWDGMRRENGALYTEFPCPTISISEDYQNAASYRNFLEKPLWFLKISHQAGKTRPVGGSQHGD